MANRPSLDEYIDVAERLQDFKDAHPEGSLQTLSWTPTQVDGKWFIVYHAAAFRTPDDTRPGHGIAWEPFPGGTPYTKNSELMNAETAAWGRAIVALGLAANRKLASRQEVRARMEEQEAASQSESAAGTNPPASTSEAVSGPENGSQDTSLVSDETLEELARQFKASGVSRAQLAGIFKEVGAEGKRSNELTEDQATWVVLKLREMAGSQ